MKKIYLSLILTGLSFSGLYAQVQMKPVKFGEARPQSAESATSAHAVRPKSIVWTEDFDIGATAPTSTAGPTFTTANGIWTTGGTNGNVWKHSFYTTSGEWSTGSPAFTPTTAANGFMLFDSDSVNLPLSPSYINLTGSLISPSIDLTLETSALLVLEQDFRFCCGGTLTMNVSVSSDGGVTWSTPYDLTAATPTNDAYSAANPTYEVQANITASAAGNNVMLKFTWDGVASGNSHYFWNLDDIYITQALTNDIVAQEPYWGTDGLNYYQIPTTQIAQIDFASKAFNNGFATQNNVQLNVDVNAGAFTDASAAATIAPGATDSLFLSAGYTPAAVIGSHDVIWGISQTEIDEAPLNNILPNISFDVTDFIYARDEGVSDGSTDNSGYGYEVGNLFDIWNDQVVKAVDVELDNTTAIGSIITAKVYSLDAAGDFVQEEQSNYHEVVAADLNGVLTLELLNPLLLTNANLTYLAVVATDGDGGVTNDMVVGTSGSSDAQTSFFYNADDPSQTAATWFYTTSTPMVRLNFDPFIGLEENGNAFGVSLYPNPASDIVTVDYNMTNASAVNVEVLDLAGNVVYTVNEGSKLSGVNTSTINTNSFASGVYYVTISTDAGSVTKKLIKK